MSGHKVYLGGGGEGPMFSTKLESEFVTGQDK